MALVFPEATQAYASKICGIGTDIKTDTSLVVANDTYTVIPGLSVSYAAMRASNRVLVFAEINYSCAGTTHGLTLSTSDSSHTPILQGDSSGSRARSHGLCGNENGESNQMKNCFMSAHYHPDTTSTLVYCVWTNSDNANALRVNRSGNDQNNETGKRGACTLCVMEIDQA